MAFNCMQMSIFLMERKKKSRDKKQIGRKYMFLKKTTARLISLIQRKLLKVDFFKMQKLRTGNL